MKTKEELALCYFRSGLNCAQSVLLAYSENYQIDLDMASGIASGFGAGMGRLQETCGAVTGSSMVLGIISSNLCEKVCKQCIRDSINTIEKLIER